MSGRWRSGEALTRWLKFNAVGGVGMCVQLLAVIGFRSIPYLDYRWATGLAVEAAVIHNFIWHERFTWVDRPQKARGRRFARFNLTTGAVSIAGNVAIVQLLVRFWSVPYIVANGIAIVLCSLFNFLLNDRFVFAAANHAAET